MKIVARKHGQTLTWSLTGFGVIAFLTALYSLFVLMGKQSDPLEVPLWHHAFYGSWFGLGALCTIAILQWKKWGVYVLGMGTLVVSIVNIIQGSATWGGVLLGIIGVYGFYRLLRPEWHWFD